MKEKIESLNYYGKAIQNLNTLLNRCQSKEFEKILNDTLDNLIKFRESTFEFQNSILKENRNIKKMYFGSEKPSRILINRRKRYINAMEYEFERAFYLIGNSKKDKICDLHKAYGHLFNTRKIYNILKKGEI